MFQKFWSLFLSFVVMVLVLTACGVNEANTALPAVKGQDEGASASSTSTMALEKGQYLLSWNDGNITESPWKILSITTTEEGVSVEIPETDCTEAVSATLIKGENSIFVTPTFSDCTSQISVNINDQKFVKDIYTGITNAGFEKQKYIDRFSVFKTSTIKIRKPADSNDTGEYVIVPSPITPDPTRIRLVIDKCDNPNIKISLLQGVGYITLLSDLDSHKGDVRCDILLEIDDERFFITNTQFTVW